MVLGSARAYRQARRFHASVYHIHDPELLPVAWLLARSGRTVVYDAHEDTPAQILDKEWITRSLRRPIAWAFDRIERRIARRLAAVVVATEKIAERFPGSTVVHNYPDLDEIPVRGVRAPSEEVRLVYVGGLTRARGALAMTRAMPLVHSVRTVLEIVGAVRPPALADELRGLAGSARTRLHGHLPWDEAWRFVSDQADIGLLLYQPARNHVAALPTKLFEYMASGLPVIASDFPLWRGILEGSGAGLVVDPEDPHAIAAAVDRLAADPEGRRDMGERARRAVAERYNWAREAAKLLELYGRILREGH